MEKYPAKEQEALGLAVDTFLRSGSADARGFILQYLHAHLLMSAASLPEATLVGLQARLQSTTEFTLVIDTNVLFSLLDLHDNPGNDPARDLRTLTDRLKGKLNIRLVVLPLTLDEAKRTLLHYKNKLSRLDLTPLLGLATLRTESGVSGITQRFLQAAAQCRPRLSAGTYFEPYLENLLKIARKKGVELYNENTEKLGTRQDVINDIMAQQDRETLKGDHAKPYEATHHDVVLWHCIDDRRGARLRLQGPLEAAYWLVTLDFQLLGFDSFKHRGQDSYIPICIHPTVLVQLFQFWLPRDASIDATMLSSLRPMLPHTFDTDAEEVTVNILASLSRYENVDDLGEDMVAEILMNQALRQRMRGEKDIERQTTLVRETIIKEAEKAKEALRHAETEKEKLHSSLEHERSQRAALAEELQSAKLISEQQERVTGASKQIADGLREKVDTLEEQLEKIKESDRVAVCSRIQVRFAIKAVSGLLVGVVVMGKVGYWIAPSIGLTGLLSCVGTVMAWIALWIQLAYWRGQNLEVVRKWPAFASFGRWRNKIWTLVGGILIAVIGNRIYDAIKTAFEW